RMARAFVLLPDGTTFIRPTGSVVLSRPDKALAAIRRMARAFVLLPDGTTFIRPTGSIVLSRPDKALAAIRRMARAFVLMPWHYVYQAYGQRCTQ
ncbi:hypothetical protein L2110_26115, partial [Citrobacter portucalensis]|nr:hypothetical protein [Citrobacter portucalensis]